MLTRRHHSLVCDLLAPSRERIERTIQMTILTAIVVLISMTFEIPSPALSTYLVFFVAKEDSGRSILTSAVFIVAICVVIGAVFLIVSLSLNHSSLRILMIAGASFALFFLGRTSKLAPLAGTLGIVMADALNAEQKAPVGEIATRGLLFALLFAIFPIAVVLVFNIFFGRHPERLLRAGLAKRLVVASNLLRFDTDHGRRSLRTLIAAGNVELLTELKMIGLFHRLPKDTIDRVKALVTVTYVLMLTAYAQRPSQVTAADRQRLAARLDDLADAITRLPDAGEPSDRPVEAIDPTLAPVRRMDALADMGDALVSGASLPTADVPESKPEKTGFFKPDAFSSPDGERFAAKGTAAVMVCYLTFNILDWDGISTCMVTCFIVALSTVGESTQKMTLRLTGCTLGAALGYAAIILVLPATTQITGLLLLIAIITVPAAWIAVGSPRVSYIGFQIAFAAYLCVLQGTEPKFDLTIARDRFIGIVFGNLTVFAIFTSVYATSLLPGLSKDLVAALERCRLVLKASTAAEPALAVGDRIAGLCALVSKIDDAVVAYGFEKRSTRHARLHVLSCRLIEQALFDVVADVAVIATLAPAEGGAGTAVPDQRCEAADRRLADLAAALKDHQPIVIDRAGRGTPRARTFDALDRHLDGLSAATQRYRRILRGEAGGSYA